MPRLAPLPIVHSEALASARDYVARGFVILPIWGVRRGACRCPKGRRCTAPGKHPKALYAEGRWRWHYVSTLPQVEKVFGTDPTLNVAIVTGEESGVFAVDVDVAKGKPGAETLARLEAMHGELPETWEHVTGSGGRHLLYRWPGFGVQNDHTGRLLGPAVDVKGQGGYVVAPPSVALSGEYVMVDEGLRDVVTAPGWLLALVRTPAVVRQAQTGPERPQTATVDPRRMDRYAESGVHAAIAALEAVRRLPSGWTTATWRCCMEALEIARSPWNSFTEREVVALLRKAAPVSDPGHPRFDFETQLDGALRRAKPRPVPRLG